MSNTMHLRIELDAKKAQQGVEALNASMLSAVKNLQELKGKGYADDSPEVKAVMNQIVGLKAIINQTLQSFRDIDAAIKNTAEVSRRELASLRKQNEKRADTLFPSDKDFKKDLAIAREREEILQREMERRKVSQRDFASALKNIANQTDDQLKVLIQQSEHAARSLQRGSVEMRNAYSAYKQFTDEQARRRGEQTYSSMIRAAGTQPDADQLRALKKEADTLMKSPLLNDESKNKLAVVIDGINEAIKRANPAPLRELDKVLKEIGSTTDLKGMEMLRLQLGGIIKAAADPKATDVMKTHIEKIMKGIADPDLVNKLKEKITKLYSSFSDPDVKVKVEEAVKGIFSSFTNPQALDDFRFKLEQAFSKLGDPMDVTKIMGNLESMFRHLTSNTDIKKARDYMNNMFDFQQDPKKVETYKKGLEDIFNTLALNFPALKGEVEQAKGYIDQFYNAISDKSKADKITSNMHDLMMAIVDPEVRIQLEQMQKLLHDGSIVDPAKVTESKGLMKDLMAALADPARRGDLPTIIDQLNGTLLSQEKISAATEKFRQLGEQIKSATPRDIDAVMGDFMGGKRGKFSLEEMLRMRDEIQKRITNFGSVMPEAELEKSNAALKNMEQNILNISRNIADGSVKASYEDMKTALSVIEGKWKTLDPNVRKNQELIAALGTEYHKLKEAVDSWGRSVMSVDELQKNMTSARAMVEQARKDPASVQMDEYQHLMRVMADANNVDKVDVQTTREAAAIHREMTEILKGKTIAIISETEAERAEGQARKILVDQEKAVISDVRDTISLYQQMVNQDDITIEKKRELGATLKQLEDLYKGVAKAAVMSEDDAIAAADKAQSLLTQIRNNGAGSVSLADVQTALQLTQDAQKAEEANLSVIQRNAALNRELTEAVKGKNVVTLEDTTIQKAQNDAAQILIDKEGALVGKVRDTIAIYQQMIAMDGQTIEKKRELGATLKQLEDLYKGEVKGLKDVVEAQGAVFNLQNFINQAKRDPSAVNAQAMRDAVTAAKAVQNTQGVSVQLSREAAAAEAEATRILQAKNVVALDSATIIQAEAEATRMLGLQEQANMGELKNVIEIYKQLVEQEDQDVKVKEERRKKLEELQKLEKGQYNLKAGDVKAQFNRLLDSNGEVRQNALTTDINDTIKALQRLKSQYGVTREESVTYDAMIKKLEKSLRSETETTKKASSAAQQLAYDEKFVTDTLKNVKKAPMEDLEKAILMCRNRMRDAQTSLTDYIKASMQLRTVRAQMGGVTEMIKEQTSAFSKAIAKLGQYLGIFGGFYLIRNQVQKAFQANIQFDDSLTNIRKTTQLTAKAVEVLANDIKHIDTRTSVQEITDLAYSAGKLGVKGVSDIMSFVRAADQIKVALGEQLGDGAAAVEQIYKVANVMGDIAEHGMEDALEKVGSSINLLTMQTQATAQPMIDFMRRLAGVGRQAGLSTSDLTGWAGAVNALGQNVELSATSLSRVMVQLSKNHKTVAQALHMTQEETEKFYYDISSGRMSEAMLTVLRMGKERGGLSQLGLIMKDISGSDGARAIQTLSTLSANYETVERMVRMSNQAYEEGTSVTNEYNMKQQNTAALLEKLKNSFSKRFISSEYIGFINKFLRSLQELPESLDRVVKSLSWLGKIVEGLSFAFTKWTPLFVGFANGLVWRTLTQGVFALGNALHGVGLTLKSAGSEFVSFYKTLRLIPSHFGLISGGLNKMQGVMRSATLAARTLGTALKSISAIGWLQIIQIGVTAFYAIRDAIRASNEEATKWNRSLDEDLAHIKTQSDITTVALNDLKKKWEEANGSEIIHKDLLEQLNTTYGAYIDNLIDEKTKYEDIAKAIAAANAELRNKAILEGRANKLKEVDENHAEAQIQNTDAAVDRIIQMIPGYEQMTSDEKANKASAIQSAILSVIGNEKNLNSVFNAVKTDAQGRVTQYGAYTNETSVSKTAMKTLSDLFADLGIADTFNNWREVSYALLPAAQEQGQINVEKSQVEGRYNAMARQETEETMEYVNDLIKESWEKVSASVYGKDFAFSRYTANDEEVKQGVRQVGEAVTYNGEAQDNYYVDVKDRFGTSRKGLADRKALETDLERFIENAKRGLAILDSRLSGTTDPTKYTEIDKRYQELAYQLRSAEAEYKVVRIGQISNVTDTNADSEARRQGNQDYRNIIQNVEELYKITATEIERQFINGGMTPFAHEDALKENEKQRNLALADVRDAIADEEGAADRWMERLKKWREMNIGGESGMEVVGRMETTSNKPGGVAQIGRNLNAGSEEDRSTMSGMKRTAEENRMNAQKIDVERYNKDLKAMLERNPMGKITDQFVEQFQQMNIMFAKLAVPEAEMTDNVEDNQRRLRSITQSVMSEYLQLGKKVSEFDITSAEGLQKYREYVAQLPLIGEAAGKASDEKLRSLYYETYQYAETYSEQITKLIERQKKVWDKMYAQTREHIASVARQADIRAQMNGSIDESAQYSRGLRGRYAGGLRGNLERAQLDLADAQRLSDGDERKDKLVEQAEERIAKLTERIAKRTEALKEAQIDLDILLKEREINIELGIDDEKLDKDIRKAEAKVSNIQKQLEGDPLYIPLQFGSKQLTNYGGSSRLAMEQDIELKREALNDAEGNWKQNIAKARNKVSAAQQDYDNMQLKQARGEATQDDVDLAYNALDEAQQQLEVISQMPDTVRTATEALTDSMITLREETMGWVSDMEKAFETFMDGFVPFRSWYEDNGSLAENIFGTKEERQEAFGAFMDDVKKTVRKSIQEYVRLRVQKSVQDKMETASKKLEEKAQALFHKKNRTEELAFDQAANATEIAADNTKHAIENANSDAGTAKAIANKTTETTGTVLGNMAQAVSKAFADLGPIAGAVAAGVVSAAIGAVLTMAMNALGGSKKKPETATKTKLVTGMLTYDSGNVQSFPVMGDDGRVYNVSHAQDSLPTGMVTKPTLTTINGAPALVGERGPEMVIGRETTRAMQMYAPELLQQISLFDRHRSNGKIKTYDEGNVSAFATAQDAPADRAMTGEEMRQMMIGMQMALAQSNEVNAQLVAQLQRGIKAHINKFGAGGLVEEVASGFVESRQMKNNKNVTRLFG